MAGEAGPIQPTAARSRPASPCYPLLAHEVGDMCQPHSDARLAAAPGCRPCRPQAQTGHGTRSPSKHRALWSARPHPRRGEPAKGLVQTLRGHACRRASSTLRPVLQPPLTSPAAQELLERNHPEEEDGGPGSGPGPLPGPQPWGAAAPLELGSSPRKGCRSLAAAPRHLRAPLLSLASCRSPCWPGRGHSTH